MGFNSAFKGLMFKTLECCLVEYWLIGVVCDLLETKKFRYFWDSLCTSDSKGSVWRSNYGQLISRKGYLFYNPKF